MCLCLTLDWFPTRVILDSRGDDVPSLLCPLCDLELELANYLFFGCLLASNIVTQISRWWGVMVPMFYSYGNWLELFKTMGRTKEFFEGIFTFHLWHIWNFRDVMLFGVSKLRVSTLLENIVMWSFLWYNCRSKISIN